MNSMIVKIQKPLESNEKNPPVLVYNQDRSYEEFLEFTDGLRQAIGDRAKIYVEARVENGVLHLVREILPQPW